MQCWRQESSTAAGSPAGCEQRPIDVVLPTKNTRFVKSLRFTIRIVMVWGRGALNGYTYLAQEIPRSGRRFSQGEILPLHYGWVDPCEYPKCGYLGSVIFDSRDCVRAVPDSIHEPCKALLDFVSSYSLSITRRVKFNLLGDPFCCVDRPTNLSRAPSPFPLRSLGTADTSRSINTMESIPWPIRDSMSPIPDSKIIDTVENGFDSSSTLNLFVHL